MSSEPSEPEQTAPVRQELVQEQIDDYRLLEVIGEGGMGVIYRAEQRGALRREVALKVIKLGLDTRAVIARFEAERQALALMSHPGIARVWGAGQTRSGRPYFAMEYVPGVPITNYCDRQKLSIRQRLELFRQVCDAIHHAHVKGIIHRDLKASNVLVTELDGKAVPKIIDFGVAKAINQRLTEMTLFTEMGRLVGTPAYMGPEQAEGGLDVDTRSDVYALGVLLYELLTGTLPFDPIRLRVAAFAEMQRIIREDEPPRPSTLYSRSTQSTRDAAQRRAATVEELASTLHHELEWIPLKAMRKDREERYQSAAEFAQDVENYLQGRPLVAAPDSRLYRVRKILRRNRGAFAAAAGILLALMIGLVVASWQMVKAQQAEKLANKSAAEALAAGELAQANQRKAERNLWRANASLAFMKDILWGIDPDFADGRDPSILLDALAEAEKALEQRLTDPLARAAYMHLLGDLYRRLGDSARARPLLVEGVNLSRELFEAAEAAGTLAENEHEVVANLVEGLNRYSALMSADGDATRALELADEAARISAAQLPPGHPWWTRSLVTQAVAHLGSSEHARALPLLEEAIAAMEARPGDFSHKDRAAMYQNRATALSSLGRTSDAAVDLDQAARLLLEAGHTKSQVYADLRQNQAIRAYARRDYVTAQLYITEVAEIRDRLLRDPLHVDRATEYLVRARLHDRLGEEALAGQAEQRRYEILRASAPGDMGSLADASRDCAHRLVRRGDHKAAISMAQQSLAYCSSLDQTDPENLRRRLAATIVLGEAWTLSGAAAEACDLLRETAGQLEALARRLPEPTDDWSGATPAAVRRDHALAQSGLAVALMRCALSAEVTDTAGPPAASLLEEAERLLLSAERRLSELSALTNVETEGQRRQVVERLIELYTQRADAASAQKWREALPAAERVGA